jgi:hypothetical protein
MVGYAVLGPLRTLAVCERTTTTGLALGVLVGVAVGVPSGVGVAVGSGVGVWVGARTGVAVASGVGVKVGMGVRVATATGVGAWPQAARAKVTTRRAGTIFFTIPSMCL